ncbi:hypothetical protein [Nocardia sp. NPDC050175]|uniref:hypothetical protein n=1 Tax=Nocardia sp. NPDC050175 TaxID=3364317 RepID=UPI00379A7221
MRFVERFGAAAAQLGSSDVAVRIAGGYAMAGAADDEERHLEYRHNDKEVRPTIARVIADRIRPTAEYN